MIIKFRLVRIFIISVLVILFPLVQNQWLNLYLFDINSFTIYKILYFLSGLIVPIFVIINSLNKFTDYKFNYHKNNNSNKIIGKLLLFIIAIILISLAMLLLGYFYINLKVFSIIFFRINNYLVQFDLHTQIYFGLITSILLIFNKTKLILKKIALINFFIISIYAWYLNINDNLSINILANNSFLLDNINNINIIYLLTIEGIFYLWSYISYGSNLSDWRIQIPHKNDFLPILEILMFYFLILLYYSILFS